MFPYPIDLVNPETLIENCLHDKRRNIRCDRISHQSAMDTTRLSFHGISAPIKATPSFLYLSLPLPSSTIPPPLRHHRLLDADGRSFLSDLTNRAYIHIPALSAAGFLRSHLHHLSRGLDAVSRRNRHRVCRGRCGDVWVVRGEELEVFIEEGGEVWRR